MKVKHFLKAYPKELITAEPDTDILTAMKLLIENGISCLPVTDDQNRLVGIISDKDIFRAVYDKRDSFMVDKVCHLMTRDILIGLENDDLDYIAGLMTNNRVRHIPVVDGEKLIGLVSIGDIVKVRMQDMEIENRHLKLYIDGAYPC